MSEPKVQHPSEPSREPRVCRRIPRDSATVRPMFPASRLLKGNIVAAEETLRSLEHAILKSRDEAAEILDQANQQATRIRSAAFERGVHDSSEMFAQALLELQRTIDTVKREAAVLAANQAFELAKVVLDVEFRLNPKLVLKVVESVLKRVSKNQSCRYVTVVVHPDFLATARAHQKSWLEQMSHVEDIEICEEPDLPIHGCRAETDVGTYDGSIVMQLDSLKKQLLVEASASSRSGRTTRKKSK